MWLREEYIERNYRYYFVKGRIISLPAFQNAQD
jgi:hypothetical protein